MTVRRASGSTWSTCRRSPTSSASPARGSRRRSRPGERRDARDRTSDPARHLAARWAAKEAVDQGVVGLAPRPGAGHGRARPPPDRGRRSTPGAARASACTARSPSTSRATPSRSPCRHDGDYATAYVVLQPLTPGVGLPRCVGKPPLPRKLPRGRRSGLPAARTISSSGTIVRFVRCTAVVIASIALADASGARRGRCFGLEIGPDPPRHAVGGVAHQVLANLLLGDAPVRGPVDTG